MLDYLIFLLKNEGVCCWGLSKIASPVFTLNPSSGGQRKKLIGFCYWLLVTAFSVIYILESEGQWKIFQRSLRFFNMTVLWLRSILGNGWQMVRDNVKKRRTLRIWHAAEKIRSKKTEGAYGTVPDVQISHKDYQPVHVSHGTQWDLPHCCWTLTLYPFKQSSAYFKWEKVL